MNQQRIDWSVPQRQSWAAIFIILYKVLFTLLKMFWPVLLYSLFKSKANKFDGFELAVVGLSVFSLLRSAIEFIYFKFYIQQDDLVIKSGFITKNTISLPLEKIQAVHIEQTWLHSLFNAARLSFDSAGSEKMEVKIDAINKTDAEEFKRFILHAKPDAVVYEAAAAPEQVLIRLNSKDLLKLSISANHLEAFLLMLAFFLSAFEQLRGIFNLELTSFVQWLNRLSAGIFSTLLLLSVVALLVSVIISTVRVLIRYYDFRISRSSRGFLIHSGLINIQEKLVPFSKIQFISWKANWIRQRMGIYLLQFHAIGSEEMNEKLRIKVPVTNPGMIPLLLDQYHGLLPVENITPVRIHPAFVLRKVLMVGILPAVIASVPLFYLYGWKFLWLLAWIGAVAVSRTLFRLKFRLWMDEQALQIRRGVFGKTELVLRWNMIQSVGLQQSIYQEGRKLATVNLYTAGGTVVIPYIPLAEARSIINYALYKIETLHQ
ncbi:MAG TPA: PH domain-containing protein [Chitinophagaceae bacterium]|nr:PH domain-containing protein [Chitinophagaceae bacterium]